MAKEGYGNDDTKGKRRIVALKESCKMNSSQMA